MSAGLHQIRLPSWSYVESIRRCSARRTPATGLADRGEIAGGREAAITTTYFGSFDLAADDVFDISLTVYGIRLALLFELTPERLKEPDAREVPIAMDRAQRNAQDLGRFLPRKPSEIAQLD